MKKIDKTYLANLSTSSHAGITTVVVLVLFGLMVLLCSVSGCGPNAGVVDRSYREGYSVGYEEGLAAPAEDRAYSYFDMYSAIEKHFKHDIKDENGRTIFRVGSARSSGNEMKVPLHPGGLSYSEVVAEMKVFEKSLSATQQGVWTFEVETPEAAIKWRQKGVDERLESIRKLKETHRKVPT